VTEFVQGAKTRRWAVGWSWADLRPKMKIARALPSLPKALLPFPSEYVLTFPGDPSIRHEEISNRLNDTLADLALQWVWKPAISTGVGFAAKNVWSRAARRKSAKNTTMADEVDEDDMAFGFKIHVERVTESQVGVQVNIRWLKGNDSVLFESFCGMIKRKVDV